jgi:hypothetical protein
MAKKRGYVTYEQLDAVLPSEEVIAGQIEDMLAMRRRALEVGPVLLTVPASSFSSSSTLALFSLQARVSWLAPSS